MKVQATIELEFGRLDEVSVRELAKQTLEARGLNVVRTSLVRSADGGRPFTPKAGKPGSTITRAGRLYEVWSEGPAKGDLWVIPKTPRPGDTEVYLTFDRPESSVRAYHADGQKCEPTTTVEANSFKRIETPCSHHFHAAAS